MIANHILNVIVGISSFVIIPVMLMTTFVLGIAVRLTFGLLLLPISLIWIVLLYPMLGLSWVCHKAPVLRDTIGVLFIPWAFVSDTFVALIPSMGELDSRAVKLMLCETWPFTWEFWQFTSHRLDLHSTAPTSVALNKVVARISRKNWLMQRAVTRISAGQQLDSDV